jgi:hypothetical protein
VESWLIVDGCQDLVPAIRAELASLGAEVELMVASAADPALRSLESSTVRRIVMRADDDSVDCLELACRALRVFPRLEVVICSDSHDRMDRSTLPATGIYFVGGPREAVAVESPEEQPSSNDADQSTARPDIVDVVRIVSYSRQTRVLEVIGAEGGGALGFIDGALTHASAGHLIGSEAFFQMVLWEECSFQAVDSNRYVESEPNISMPTAELLDEAVNLLEAIESDDFEAPQSPEVAAEGVGFPGFPQWWARAAGDQRPIVRVLVGYPPETSCRCVRAFTSEVSDHLKPVKRWISEPKIGPTFVRLHCDDGTILNLTFIAMKPSNRFFFETFAGASETVIICRSDDSCGPELWRDWVPEGVRVVTSEESVADNGEHCPALQRLAEDAG